MATNFRFRDDWLADTDSAFTWRSVLALVSACRIAYHSSQLAEKVAREEWGMEADAFDVGGSQGIIVENSRVMVIAFRGTDSVADWLGNLKITPRDVPAFGGAAHCGFLEAYDRVAPIVADAIARAGDRAVWFTGHSLGGALALVGALTHQDTEIAGLMTFGQPRLLGRRPARRFADRFGQAYRRFVNRDDVVTRVPPGYSHTGHLVHFTGAGSGGVEFGLEEFDPSAENENADEASCPALSSAEFAKLQEAITAIKFEIASLQHQASDVETEITPDELLDASVEGLIPGVSAHRIDAYLAEVNARAVAEMSLIGPHETFTGRRVASFRNEMALVEEPLEYIATEEGYGPESARPEPEATYLLRLRTSEWTPPFGVKLRSFVGDIASVSATAEGVRRLTGDKSVIAFEASREAGIEDLSTSVPHVKGDVIHARPGLVERGDAALVGIIDTGIDILHEAFNDANGDSRVLAVWLQWDNSGPSPNSVDPKAFSQDYGTLYVAEDIARFRKAHAEEGAAPPAGLRDEYSGHGTHVSSIAAGRSFAGVGDGMAPDAAIIAVAAHTTTDPADPDEPKSIGYSSSHVDALAFLKRTSQGGNKVLSDARPMAVNVSLGMNAGAHDGQTMLEAAFDGITGGGRDPGLVVVKSAGNERTHAGHASAQAAQGALVEVAWFSAGNNRKRDYLEAWFEPGDEIEFTLVTPAFDRVGPVNFDKDKDNALLETSMFVCRLSVSECHRDNGHNRLTISVERKRDGRIPPGRWSLEMVARRVASTTGNVNIWAERVADRSIRFEFPDPRVTLSIPGTARTVITVGACNSSFPMRLLGASSLGLTRDGRPKPELCAPGDTIVAACAAVATDASTAKSGTSMAAPHVTGAVALVFSALAKSGKRQPDAMQLLQKLRLTTQNFSHIHNPGFGSGILDAEKFFNDMT